MEDFDDFNNFDDFGYRVSWIKLENCRWLFEIENMDRFLIKWYFY